MKRTAILLLVAALAQGCQSGRFPVAGQVTYEDGTPVVAGTVIAEATVDGKLVGVQGAIASDGHYSLGADRPGDGALPGSYRVLVVPPSLGDAEKASGKRPAVSGRYGNFDTSGLTLEVKPQRNELNIKVTRPAPREQGD